MSTRSTRLGRFLPVALLCALACAVAWRAQATVTPNNWAITGTSPPSGSTWHTTDTINFSSRHTASFHRVPGVGTDGVTCWAKNGYATTLIGSSTDAKTWTDTIEEDWHPNLSDPHGVANIAKPGFYNSFYKTTYRTNVMSQEALVYKIDPNTGQQVSAYVSFGFQVIQ